MWHIKLVTDIKRIQKNTSLENISQFAHLESLEAKPKAGEGSLSQCW